MTGRRDVLLVDKDGTLIEDLPYNVDPSRVRFARGAREAVRRLGAAGWELAIVTNQSGVARGYFEMPDVERLADHLRDEVAALGSGLAGFYVCPHLAEGDVAPYARACACRKPLPGLLEQAAAELGLDLRGSWFVGDTWMDVAAGHAAGCRTALVGPEWRDRSTHPPGVEPDLAVPDLLAVVNHVLGAAASAGVRPGRRARSIAATVGSGDAA